MKKTLVIGASENPERYSNKAIRALIKHGHEVVAIGSRSGNVDDVKIETGHPNYTDIHTITLYIGTQHQELYSDYIIGLKPVRIIFNPGTENPRLMKKFQEAGIEVTETCTLVLLSIGAY